MSSDRKYQSIAVVPALLRWSSSHRRRHVAKGASLSTKRRLPEDPLPIGRQGDSTTPIEQHISLMGEVDVSIESIVALTEGSQIALPALCTKISQFQSLQRAKVVASECYVTHTLVKHRYLVLEVKLKGHPNVFLRLDRRGSFGNALEFIFGSSTSRSNDSVRPTVLPCLVFPELILIAYCSRRLCCRGIKPI